MRTAAIAGALLILALVAGTLLVGGGLYDVAATRQHLAPTYWLLKAAMRRSIQVRARAVTVPDDLRDPQRIARGASLYRASCLRCHGAPGVAPEPFALGLTPVPENLAHAAAVWHAREIFWAAKNGIKMTGMPAWKYRLSDEQLWDVVAFIEELPRLSPVQYRALRGVEAQPGAMLGSTRAPDARRGRQAIRQYACVTCHSIPGVVGASVPVGPPLAHFANRSFVAGVLPNTQYNLARWIQGPQRVKPATAMPDLRVKEEDAADIAAYLGSLH